MGVVEPGFRDGGYPLHLPFLWGHMISHSTSYFFLQSGLLCLIIQKHITNNDCCPYLCNLAALLPVSIWPVSSYCSSDFKKREYKCSLASRWWAATESRACLRQVSGSPLGHTAHLTVRKARGPKKHLWEGRVESTVKWWHIITETVTS